jgi:hypothetical protein
MKIPILSSDGWRRVEEQMQMPVQSSVRAVEGERAPSAGRGLPLHAFAKARYTRTNPLVLEALEQQAEAVSGTFTAQDVEITLWAYETMGGSSGRGR